MIEINKDYVPKPPLGIMPRWLWDERNPTPTLADVWQRLNALNDAIKRYEAAGKHIPDEWYKELAPA